MDIQNLTRDDIVSVYSGRAGKCCCGCAGKHTYNSKHVDVASKSRGYAVAPEEVNDTIVTKVLRTVQANEECIRVDLSSPPHVSVDVGQRRYILYLLPTKA